MRSTVSGNPWSTLAFEKAVVATSRERQCADRFPGTEIRRAAHGDAGADSGLQRRSSGIAPIFSVEDAMLIVCIGLLVRGFTRVTKANGSAGVTSGGRNSVSLNALVRQPMCRTGIPSGIGNNS